MNDILFFGIIFVFIGLIVLYIVLSFKKAKKTNTSNLVTKVWEKEGTKTTVASLISIFSGLVVGVIVLLSLIGSKSGENTLTIFNAIDAVELLFAGVFCVGKNSSTGSLIFGFNGSDFGDMLNNAMPLILTGLSVGLAFKAGLFNIGAPGQWLMGTNLTFIVALSMPTKYNVSWYEAGFMGMEPQTPAVLFPVWIVWILAFLSGTIGGALWGAIPGFFKAHLNINEVITCIMTNWIAANFSSFLFDRNSGPFRALLDPSGTKNKAYLYMTTANGVFTPKLGLDKIFQGSQINGGFIFAIIIAIIIFIILEKTTFGFELKSCGSNRNASRYAGINDKRNIVLSMIIAGALAGAGASLYYLSGNTEFKWDTYQSLPSIPFNGIPTALLASNSPIGVIFTAIFMGYLNVAGTNIKYKALYNEYIASFIIAIIVYFSAFTLIIRNVLKGNFKFQKKKKDYEIIPTKEEIQIGEEIKKKLKKKHPIVKDKVKEDK